MATRILSDLLKQHAAERLEAIQACRPSVALFETSVFADVGLRPRVKQRLLSEVLFLLGHNPELRITVVTRTLREAKDTMRDLAKAIRANDVLHLIFPDLVPSEEEGARWSEEELTVKRSGRMVDPSVRAVCLDTKVTASRIDVVVVSGTIPIGRWYQEEILSRLTKQGREIPILG